MDAPNLKFFNTLAPRLPLRATKGKIVVIISDTPKGFMFYFYISNQVN